MNKQAVEQLKEELRGHIEAGDLLAASSAAMNLGWQYSGRSEDPGEPELHRVLARDAFWRSFELACWEARRWLPDLIMAGGRARLRQSGAFILAVLDEPDDDAERVSVCRQGITTGDPYFYFELGKIHAEADRHEDAASAWEAGFGMSDPKCARRVGDARLGGGDDSGALEALEVLIQAYVDADDTRMDHGYSPDDLWLDVHESAWKLGDLYRTARRDSAAIRAYEVGIEVESGRAALHLAWLYEVAGREAEAAWARKKAEELRSRY